MLGDKLVISALHSKFKSLQKSVDDKTKAIDDYEKSRRRSCELHKRFCETVKNNEISLSRQTAIIEQIAKERNELEKTLKRDFVSLLDEQAECINSLFNFASETQRVIWNCGYKDTALEKSITAYLRHHNEEMRKLMTND